MAVTPHTNGALINQPDESDAEKPASPRNPRKSDSLLASTVKKLEQAQDDPDFDSDEDNDTKTFAREALTAKDEDEISRLFVREQADWQHSISTKLVKLVLPSKNHLGLLVDDLPIEQMTREIQAYPKVQVDSTGLIAAECAGDQSSNNAFFDTCLDTYKLRVIRVNDAHGSDALAYLRRVLFQLKQGMIIGQTSLSIEFAKDRLYKFQYKHREHTGTLLHIAALHRDGHYLMDSLIDARADPSEPCNFPVYGCAGAARALHLASGVGNIAMMQLLMNSDVDVNAKSKHGDRTNYTALHEATYHSQAKAVGLLLKSRASPNLTNIKDETALHIAVSADNPALCRLLVAHKADLHGCTRKKETPLTLAILHSPSSLHLVTDKRMDEVLRIAKAFPEENLAYKVLLTQSGKVRSSWVQSLCEQAKHDPEATLRQFLEFAEVSPQAAATLLTAMALPPTVEHSDKNPLPLRAKISGNVIRFHTDLQVATCWATEVLPWMNELCPGRAQEETIKERQQWRRVHVKVVRLPGVVSLPFLQVLAQQDQEHLFKSVVSVAVLNFCWYRIAKSSFICSGFLKFLVLAVLTASVAARDTSSETFKRIAWSLVAVVAHVELVHEIFELCHYLRHQQVYEYCLKNWKDWLSLVLLVTVVYASALNYDLCSQPELVAFLVLMRWTQLAWAFRAFEIIGPSILPIMLASFGPIQGILMLVLFGFFGFYTAFLSLAGKQENADAFSLLLNTVRLLLLGDGDGIDAVLRLGSSSEDEASGWGFAFLMMAILVFTIILLNLFIAVYGEAYDLCQEQAWGTFLRERAEICLHAFVKPEWPPPFCKGAYVRHRKIAYSMLVGAGFVIWFLLLYNVNVLPPIVPTALLTVCLIVGDCILRQKPWHSERDPMSYHLWMCHASDFDETRFWPAAKSEERKPHDRGTGVRGRHLELKQDFMLRQREMSAKLEYMQCKVDTSFRTMERSLTGLSRSMKQSDSRITRLESSLAKLADEIGPHLAQSRVSGGTAGSRLGVFGRSGSRHGVSGGTENVSGGTAAGVSVETAGSRPAVSGGTADTIPEESYGGWQLHSEVSRPGNGADMNCLRGIIPPRLDRQASSDAILE